jgi:transglutaminase-like putative cysteine protease
MLRPRDSHSLRLRDTALVVTPPPFSTRWLFDVYGNCVALLDFLGETTELRIESRIELESYALDEPELVIEPFTIRWPFEYALDEQPDLAPYRQRHWEDAAARLDRWARRFVRDRDEIGTRELLQTMARTIKDTLPYQTRPEEGTRSPLVTLEQGGTCRDFAALMMEALRTLGIAARFVSGYIYSPALDPNGGGGPGSIGAGATHAWVDVYLPSAGWIEVDPTNALIGGRDLVRVCVARMPDLAVPVSGSFTGPPGAALPLEVSVTVERH